VVVLGVGHSLCEGSGGQHYCKTCARFFVSAPTLEAHVKSKVHKQRLKIIAEEKYTQVLHGCKPSLGLLLLCLAVVVSGSHVTMVVVVFAGGGGVQLDAEAAAGMGPLVK
jgi:hypothetical protein